VRSTRTSPRAACLTVRGPNPAGRRAAARRNSGKAQHGTIHLGSNGSLRSGARSFVIGNGIKGDTFRITTAHCGHHAKTAWILGYAPASGRWGYVEAMHLPACL
jgi:hypothetical protein